MFRRHNKTGRSKGRERFVSITNSLMRTDAWRDLDCVARCAYIEIAARYAGPGTNNGRIPYSLREMATALNCSRATAMRALHKLQDRGFLAMTKKGAFSVKCRVATEWRLTEHGCDLTGAAATKNYTKWTKKQNT